MSKPHIPEHQLTPDLLLRAYAAGIFPMAESRDDAAVFWVDPQVRGILPLDDFHVSRSLRKKVRSKVFDVTCDKDFGAVIRACAATGKGRQDTWINDEIIRAYSELHLLGYAHSVECWHDGKLAGGLYGVALAGVFCGESMFTDITDASKVALAHLVARLKLAGFVLLDTQFVTEHLRRFGAIEIPAREYLLRLEEALQVDTAFTAQPAPDDLERVMDDILADAD